MKNTCESRRNLIWGAGPLALRPCLYHNLDVAATNHRSSGVRGHPQTSTPHPLFRPAHERVYAAWSPSPSSLPLPPSPSSGRSPLLGGGGGSSSSLSSSSLSFLSLESMGSGRVL